MQKVYRVYKIWDRGRIEVRECLRYTKHSVWTPNRWSRLEEREKMSSSCYEHFLALDEAQKYATELLNGEIRRANKQLTNSVRFLEENNALKP